MDANNEKFLLEYLKTARTFDQDQQRAAERSKKVAWAIAATSTAVAAIMGLAVAALVPLKEVTPFVIRVDNATGIPEVMTSLSDGQETYEEAVTRYFLARYVRVREGYNYAERENIFREISLMSSPSTHEQFSAFFNATNPQSPQFLYGRDTKATIGIRSISFLGDELAQVRFTRTEFNERENTSRVSQWVATIEYTFDGSAQISSEDRTINPLGFIVKNYRADSEVIQ